MVLSDGAESSRRGRLTTSHRLVIVIGVVALAAGMWGLGNLTGAEPSKTIEIVSSPTTPTMERVDWERVAAFPKAAIFTLTRLGDDVVVFSSTSQTTDPALTGLHVWRSDDGVAWDQGGSVVAPDSRIESVTSTALGIVALGFAPNDDSLRAWLSEDGDFWLPLADGLPLDTDGLGSTRAAVGAHQETLTDIDSFIGRDARVVGMTVKDERGIALVTRSPDRSRPYDIASFEIWAAPLG